MPVLGFGTWDSPQDKTTSSVLTALSLGYRHIDTAQAYGNEAQVGAALRQSGIPRSEIFVTTKIWQARGSVAANYASCLASIELLDAGTGTGTGAGAPGSGYVDQFLIHNVLPSRRDREQVWAALERLRREGRVRTVGVSNWGVRLLEECRAYADPWPPQANQLELHPWCQQRALLPYLARHGVAVAAYSPLVRNREAANEVLAAVAREHGRTEPQVLIRYCLQKGWAPLPKSDKPERIAENADVFGFHLSPEEMEALDGVRREGKDEPCVMVAEN
ncbi:MAG: hypothetical protein LQ340_001443 [Diploschistes diacapsis]|nr:MAG: hypothetical protein LQ340_001443 [Diploschistes diacapsis]